MEHNQPVRPNLFIVGAPKCGTTSMHGYLAQHPDVFMTTFKEPHFFGRDLALPASRRIVDEVAYLAPFTSAADVRWRGESSTWYLFSTQAAREIRQYAPAARILIMLRNPVDTLYSLHGQYLYSGNEDLTDFEQALSAQDDRRHGRRIPAYAQNPQGLLYGDVVAYAQQVQRYFDAFGRENVHVILFDDFVKDTLGEFKKVLRFLDLADDFQPDLTVLNPARAARIPWVIRLDRGVPGLRRLYHRLFPAYWRDRIFDALAWLSRAPVRPGKITPDLRARLAPMFREEVESLSELLGRDLSHWSAPSPKSPQPKAPARA
jgi:hypothetical protein